MTSLALVLAPIAPSVRVECSPLKATISARQCLAVQRRTERRPFACAGCPIGDAVRAGAGDTGPAPVAFVVVAAELEPAPPARVAPSAPSALAALRALIARHGTCTAASHAAGISKTTGLALAAGSPVGEGVAARLIAAVRDLPAAPVPTLCRRPDCGAPASLIATKYPVLEGLCLVHRETARMALRFDRTDDARLCTGCYARRALRGAGCVLCRECTATREPAPTRSPLAGTREPAAADDHETIAAWSARRAVK